MEEIKNKLNIPIILFLGPLTLGVRVVVCISHAFCLLGDEYLVKASGHSSLQIVIAKFRGDEATTES